MSFGLGFGFMGDDDSAGVVIPNPDTDIESPSQGEQTINAFNADEGTIYFEFSDSDFQADAGNDCILCVSNGTTNNRFFVQKNTDNLRVFSSTGSEMWEGFLSSVPTGRVKMAISYSSNNFQLYCNGMKLMRDKDDSTFSLPASLNRIDLSILNSGTNAHDTVTRHRFKYWPKRLNEKQNRSITRNFEILSSPTDASDKLMVMLWGQSNAVGDSEDTATYNNPDNIYKLTNAMAVEAYSDPYDATTGAALASLNDTTPRLASAGFLADRLFELRGQDIIVCPAARGSTSFAGTLPSWRIDGDDYREGGTNFIGQGASITSAIHQLLMAEQHSPVQAIFWFQGEASIASGVSQAVHEEHYRNMIREVRAALGRNITWYDMGVPEFNADFASSQADYDAIVNAKIAVMASEPSCTYVGSGLPGQANDEKHYTMESYRTLGQMAAHAFHEDNPIEITVPTPDFERTSGFPSLDTRTINNTTGFSTVVEATVNKIKDGVEYQGILYASDASGNNQLQILRRHGTGKYWMRVRHGGNQNLLPLDNYHDDVTVDGKLAKFGLSVKQIGSKARVRFFIDGVMAAWLETTVTLGTYDRVTAGRSHLTANNSPYDYQRLLCWDQELSRLQMEAATDNVGILGAPVYDANNKFVMWVGNSNANGTGSGSPTYTNDIKQLGKDLTTGIKDFAANGISGGDDSTFGDLWDVDGSGFSGLGNHADLLQTANGGQYIGIPMGQGGLLLSSVTQTNNFNAKLGSGSGYYINPRALTIIKTLKLAKQLGSEVVCAMINGHNDAAQGVLGSTYETDLNNFFDLMRYHHQDIEWIMPSIHQYDAAMGSFPTDPITSGEWAEIKDLQDTYTHEGLTVVDGTNFDYRSGDEMHLDATGQIEMATAMAAI